MTNIFIQMGWFNHQPGNFVVFFFGWECFYFSNVVVFMVLSKHWEVNSEQLGTGNFGGYKSGFYHPVMRNQATSEDF